ncbi:MAG: 50S ribosomal protein L1 [Nanobdellota archaeon]
MTVSKKHVLSVLKEMRENGKKRNFTQTVEMFVNLKDLNLKKPEEQVEFFTQEPQPINKRKICAIVGPDTETSAKEACDKVILQSELDDYKKDKKAAKKLADEYDFFIAQANLMGQIAGAFGRIFGPRGKMPNPKAGCVIPPKASIKPLYERLQTTVKVSAKKFPVIHVVVGKEDMDDEAIAENIVYFYDQVEHHLPRENHNIKNALIKTTMGAPIKLA